MGHLHGQASDGVAFNLPGNGIESVSLATMLISLANWKARRDYQRHHTHNLCPYHAECRARRQEVRPTAADRLVPWWIGMADQRTEEGGQEITAIQELPEVPGRRDRGGMSAF